MTAKESERLSRMEEHQQHFAEAIKKFDKRLEELDKKLDNVNSTLDNLTGGKQALMWVTGITISIAALVAAYINVFKGK